jgi:hypothetical protein
MEKDIIQLKVDMREVKTDIKHIKEGHKNLDKKVGDGFKDLGKKIENMNKENEKKFSAKWVEKFLIWVGRVVGVSIIGGVVYAIWKAAVHFIG